MSARRIAVALLALWLLAACVEGRDPSDPPSPDATTPSASPTESPTPEPTGSPSGSPTPTASVDDGRHFGYIQEIEPGSPTTIEFDLAYFLTGDEANEAAEERGDEIPVPNDYYIVNDNPRLRSLTLASDVKLILVDWEHCCDTFVGELDPFLESFEATTYPDGNYTGSFGQYWLVVRGGEVVTIEEQYLP